MKARQLVSRFMLVSALGTGALSSGCALMTPDCTQNWHDAGVIDGRAGTPARDVQYQQACGARFDASQYVGGWQDGLAVRPALGGS